MTDLASADLATAQGFASLFEAYENRLKPALEHRAAGGEVVGAVNLGFPSEVALACGCLPVAIAPLPSRLTPFADPWVNATLDPQKRVVFDQLLSGEVQFMGVVVHVANALQESYTLYWARYLLGQGKGAALPPLHQYVLLGNHLSESQDYSFDQTRSLARRLRAITGQEATPERLAEAIKTVNAARAELRELNRHRRAGRVSGVEALKASAAFRFMHPSVYTPALAAFNAAVARAPVRSGPRAIVVAGAKLSDTAVHEALEDGGLTVVAEDDAWGARAGTPDVPAEGDLLKQIFDHYHLHTPNRAVYPATVRYAWLYEEAAKSDVDVVVFYMPPSDRALGWDYPRLFDHFEALGKTVIKLRCDLALPEGRAEAVASVRNAVQAFKEAR